MKSKSLFASGSLVSALLLTFAALCSGACSQFDEYDGFNRKKADPAPASPSSVDATKPKVPSSTKTNGAGGATVAAQAQTGAQSYPLTTLLPSKGTVISPYDQKTLELPFAVTGGAVSATINDFRFQCKRENQSNFSPCPEPYKYTFSDLKSGTVYSLTVRAVSVSKGTVAKPDTISFRAK
ncbi:MAG: hypothetical protein NTY08_11900 [Proteobacteria bacterium]|nr:hypothetical protein [Pseudomonadota bacterium]